MLSRLLRCSHCILPPTLQCCRCTSRSYLSPDSILFRAMLSLLRRCCRCNFHQSCGVVVAGSLIVLLSSSPSSLPFIPAMLSLLLRCCHCISPPVLQLCRCIAFPSFSDSSPDSLPSRAMLSLLLRCCRCIFHQSCGVVVAGSPIVLLSLSYPLPLPHLQSSLQCCHCSSGVVTAFFH